MEQKEKAIGTDTYLCTQMDAISALRVQTKLIKILGPGVFSLVGNDGDLKSKISTLVPALMENFDDEEVTNLVLSLFKSNIFIKVNDLPKKVDFSTHFAGKPMEMWKVAAFILETNFSLGKSIGSILPTTDPAKKTQEN